MSDEGILIIGASGFLGSALSIKLLGQGFCLHRLVRHPVPSLGRGDHVHVGTLEDTKLLQSVLPKCKIVFHLASATTPSTSANSPSLEAKLNLLPTMHLIETLQDHRGTKLIFTSSGGTMYGNPDHTPVPETASLQPQSYHGAGKFAIESFLRTFHQLTNQSITILRPSNLYGPGQSLRSGFGLVRNMLDHALNGTPLNVWGDGESIRDFLFIDDMVDACCRTLAEDNSGWQVFNVGSETGYSINQVRQIVESITGVNIPTIYHPPRQEDVRRIILDCSEINAQLGWRSKFSLKEGIQRTWQWLNNSAAAQG